jgi:hypothetical protein
MVGDEMTHLYNNNSLVAAATTIFTLAIIIVVASSMMTANAATATATIMQQPTVTTTAVEDTSNNVSDSVLGSLFMIHEGERTSFNPINDTYTEISVVSNTTIMPPNATTTINATERGNLTLNIQPNGVTLAQGQGFLVTLEDEAVQEENATATIIELNASRVRPDGMGSATGVVFYDTNSTGQLAFLDNIIGISQREITPEGYTIRIWEWKGGGTIPFETTTN